MAPRRRTTPDGPELARLPDVNAPAGMSTPLADGVVRTPTEERRERELEDVLSELGTDGRITVYHITEGKAAFAGTMTLDGFSLETLLDTFGGGDKSLVIYQGKTKVDTVRVSLDPSIPVRNPKSSRLAAVPVAAPSGLGDMTTVLASMAQMSMQQMAASQQMMTGMVTAMTALMTARPEKDPMETALKMAQVMGEKRSDSAPASELFSMLERGINMGKLLSGGGNDEDPTLGIVREGLGTLGKIVDATTAARRQDSSPPMLAATGGAPIVGPGAIRDTGGGARDMGSGAPGANGTASGTPDGGGAVMRPWVRVAKEHEQALLMAARFLSGDTAAIEMLRRMDDESLNDLLQDMEEAPEEFESRVRAAFPDFHPSPEWFAAFVGTIRANVTEDAADDAVNTDDRAPGVDGAEGTA